MACRFGKQLDVLAQITQSTLIYEVGMYLALELTSSEVEHHPPHHFNKKF